MSTRIDDERAVELATYGLSNYAIAGELDCDEASVRRALHRSEFQRHLIPVDLESRFNITLDQPMRLRDVNPMVTADWHIPLYDARYVNAMIETAREKGIRDLIVGGDYFNYDSLSAYDPKQDEANLTVEYEEAIKVMLALTESFDRIYFLWGNHDARMHKALGYAMKFRDAMKMVFGALGTDLLSKVEFTNLDHMWLEFPDNPEGRDKWYVCHPASYSRIPLSNPIKLAAKVNASVVCAHSHHAAMGYAMDGKKVVAEAGGLFDQKKTAYLQRTTTFPTWTPGFGWFENGTYHMTTPGWEA